MRVLLYSFTFAEGGREGSGFPDRGKVIKLNCQLVDKELGVKYEVHGQYLWTMLIHLLRYSTGPIKVVEQPCVLGGAHSREKEKVQLL